MPRIFFLLLFVFAVNFFAQTTATAFSGLNTEIESIKTQLISLAATILSVSVFVFGFFAIVYFIWREDIHEEIQRLKDCIQKRKDDIQKRRDDHMAAMGYVRKDPYKVKYYGTEYVKESDARYRRYR